MICRLCLKNITEVILIFDAVGIELNVADVLAKYFWFEPKRDDPISTAICNSCWIAVSNFHEFYLSVQESHRLLSERFSIKDEETKTGMCSSPLLEGVTTTDHNSDRTKFEPTNHLDMLDTLIGKTEIEPSMDSLSPTVDFELSEKEETAMMEIKEVLQQPQLRRSTRCTMHGNADRVKNLQENRKCTSEIFTTPIKRRRGRPRKNQLESLRHEKDLTDQRANIYDSAPLNSLEPSKKCDMDAKIAQHMSLTCDICAMELPTFSQLRIHMAKAHNCKGYAVCCTKKFYKRVLLVDHIEKHLNPDCYRCEECDKVFADKQCMRNHFLLKHQPDELKTFICEQCPKKFAKSYLLEQHRVVHVERTHICELCQRGFPTTTMLVSHNKMVHNYYGTMCDICAKVIRGRAAFDRHQLEHSGVVLPKVQCDKCGSWHKDKYSLQKHKRRHNDEGSTHVCNICGKVAPNRSALLSHQRYVHTAKRTFECSVCKKAFKKAINLKEHMTTHTGEVLYKCPHCPKTFNSNANMHSHRKKVHPKEFEEARKNRRENTNQADVSQPVSVPTPASGVVSQLITIKTAQEGETHRILVTTDNFSDGDADVDEGDSIIFTVN